MSGDETQFEQQRLNFMKTKKKKCARISAAEKARAINQPAPAFITCYADGSVRIQGGLVFCPGDFIHTYPGKSDAGHVVAGSYFYGNCPKWHELRKWWRLIQLIRQYTRKEAAE
jgi:hypothetical protein